MGRLEVGSILVFEHDGAFWLALEDLDTYASVRIERVAGRPRAHSPIGDLDLAPSDIVVLEGREHLAPQALTEKLRVMVRFDPQEYALELRPPWLGEVVPEDLDPSAPKAAPPTPEFPAPGNSLSRLASDTWYYGGGSDDRIVNQTTAEGRLAGGRWRIRYFDDFVEGQQLEEYAWVGARDKGLLLLGRQWTSLHPLLGSYELTGVQYAWTNQPPSLFAQSADSRSLIPRGLQPYRSFSGEGPPGGTAELWMDDQLVATRTVRLDGHYDFLDVPLPTRSAARVEVRVYDRFDRAIPVAIHEQSIRASEYLLPKGAVMHQAGLGVAGNFVNDTFFDNQSGESGTDPGAFYQWRWGMSERLTLETAIQRSPDRTQTLAGVIAQLTDTATLALALAQSDGYLGYQVGLDFQRGNWRAMLDAYYRQAGFFADDDAETYDYSLEIGRRMSPKLDLSLVGGYRQSGAENATFLLPALWWRPLDRLFLRVRPDFYGDYLADADLRLGAKTRLAARYDGDLYTEAAYRIDTHWEAVASADFGEENGNLYGAQLRWQGEGRRRPSVRAALLYGDQGGIGFAAGASLEVIPGVFASIEASSEPLDVWLGQDTDMRLRALVSIDFGLARGRLVPTRSLAFSHSTGAIGGRIRVENPPPGAEYDLSDIGVSVQGGPSGRTTSGGELFIGGVAPGIRTLTLDPEKLPIELVPERLSVVAEVAAGAITRVDFTVRPEYGLAGRVRDASGNALPDRSMELYDAQGQRRGQAVTDRFGLYRMDGVPPGRYELRLVAQPGETEPMPRRGVVIARDFIFDQDLKLP
jgi:hypothetical protein